MKGCINTMTYCCTKCFDDAFLIGLIVSEQMLANCDYCGRTSENAIQVNKLKKYFERFYDIYEIEQDGVHYVRDIPINPTFFEDYIEPMILTDCYPLHILLQKDWGVFSKNISEDIQKNLLADILKDSKIPYFLNLNYSSSKKFARFFENVMYYEDKQDIWSHFSIEIKNMNRFFVQNSLQEEIVDLFKQKEIVIEENACFYRARIGYEENKQATKIIPYDKNKMGKPPVEYSSNGRANPKGISYLYTASDVETAISEVRPWKSAIVSVVQLVPKTKLKVIDLTQSTKLTSPFHSTNLRNEIEIERLLESLSNEFSKPVSPFDGDVDYVPTQYIAELIKYKGYKGFKFKSSLADGDNFVFFDERVFEFKETTLHRVENVLVEQSLLNL